MRKVLFLILAMVFSVSALAQQKIQLRSADKAECVSSDMTSLRASFSFSSIEAKDYASDRGTFSWLSLPNTVRGGNEGDPQIPVINQLIAVPVGAQPWIEITSYSATDYNLADYGMKALVPRQPSLRKDKRPEDVPFVMNEAAYQSTRSFKGEPTAVVSVEGTMRGVQLGKMTIEPVSYDPVNNKIRVFNDIEVTVHFDGADAKATEDLLLETYSPYFDIVYKSLFNGRAVLDAYTEHPDLYSTPVKMLVVTTSTFANSTPFQNWLTWKKQKGFDVDVQTVTSNTPASSVRSLIQSQYNANHPSFLVIVGDETVVTNYSMWDYSSTYGNAATDLEYASVDGDIYHDMFMSRMPVSSTTELGYLVDKILMYEKYEMPDPSYLNETLLIAGWDEPQTYQGYTYPSWTNVAGKPTIQYANNNYFNSAHGITPHVFITTGSGQTTCYNYINQVGFINYTAHGDIQEWSDPNFTNSQVNSLTNTNKPFWAMGNCCLTANLKNSKNNQTCYGETMVRAQNKGAFGYIGSMVESYWFEDFYFGVGAFNAAYSTNNNPTVSGTQTGAYDALFDDTGFNTLNAVPYIGNISVSYAYTQNYQNSSGDDSPCNPEYYWRCYQCYGDGSVMPYLKVPAANNVSHANTLPIGSTSFTVSADAGSYVSITVDNEIIGVAAVPANATSVDVTITPQTHAGTAMIVVTRNQRQPYINDNVSIISATQYNITASANPSSGGTVVGAGTYYETAQCTLVATPNLPQFEFANWTLGNNVVSTDANYSFYVSGDASYTANFTALTKHSVTCNATEHGTISTNKVNAYKNETVTLTATPDANYSLDHWVVSTPNQGNVSVVNNQFTMPDSDVTISAVFNKGYSVSVMPLIGGTITSSASTAEAGNTVNLTVTPNTGYSFISWNVYETGNSSNTVTVTNNRFTMPAFGVTVSALFGTSTTAENTITVGTGTTTNSNLPTASNRTYTLSEQIYTASELGSAGSITGIEFYYSGSTARTRTLDIYLAHTTKTSFSNTSDWVRPSSSDLVYSGSVAFTTGSWKSITFNKPFEYNGTSNVVLILDDNTGTAQSNLSFYVTSTSNYQALYITGTNSSANTNYDPTSITTSGSRTKNKNSVKFHKMENQVVPLVCDAAIANVTFDVTANPVTVSIEGDADSYIVRYRAVKFHYDFESATPWAVDNFSPCTTYDGDGSATYGVQNVTFTNSGYTGSFIAFQNNMVGGLDAHGGNAFGACFAATTPPNNDFFILPQLTIENGDVLSFWAKEYTSQYPESFKVGVYSSNGSFSSYLAGSATSSITPNMDWTQYSYDLSAYAGQTIKLAIQCVSNDAFIFCIDDITITNANSWDGTITNVTSSHAITGLTGETLYDVQVVGVCDGIGENAGTSFSFTTPHYSTFTKDIAAWGEGNGWYLIASPLDGTITPSEVTNMTSPNDFDLYYFDQAQAKEWVNYKLGNGNHDTGFGLVSGKGYLYANQGQVTLTFTGIPYSNNGEVTITNVEGHSLSGWNLIGNPWNTTATIGKDFLRMNDDHNEIIPAEDENIAPMEGIFVHTDNDGETVAFSTGGAKADFVNERIVLNLSHNGGKVIDRAIVRFGDGSTLPKLQIRDNSTKLYFTQGNRDYAVVRVNKQDEMPVNFKASENGPYTITIDIDDVSLDYLHLIDNLTGNDIDLLATPSYSFNAKTSDYASRFKLVFAVEGENLDSDFAFVSNGQIIINGQGTVQVIDVLGRIITNVETSYYGVSTENMVPGIYILRLINGSDVKTQKIVIE